MSHYNLVHNPIPLLKAMKSPDANAVVDEESEKLKNLSGWQESKVKSKRKVIDEAQKEDTPVHFATIVDLYHLKNAELDKRFQKIQRT